MITYEVRVEIDKARLAQLDAYMTEKHIGDVMATGCFLTARYFAAGERRRTVYEAADQESLDRYLNTHAGLLRQDFIEHFPNGIEITREVWQVIGSF